jgi:drug/metabolite transporter (DMT)-like permease
MFEDLSYWPWMIAAASSCIAVLLIGRDIFHPDRPALSALPLGVGVVLGVVAAFIDVSNTSVLSHRDAWGITGYMGRVALVCAAWAFFGLFPACWLLGLRDKRRKKTEV